MSSSSVEAAVWAMMAFMCGALPFSVWLGRWAARADIRQVGDGNPGAANAWRAGGWRVGVPALLLDYLKGALPVGLAFFVFGVSGWAIVPVALAPVLGHALSPFLKFRGGKGLAVTFGAWSGLTLAHAPIVLGLFMVLFYFALTADAWAVVFSMAGLLAHLLLQNAESWLVAFWACNLTVLVWKHWRDLHRPLRLRPLRLKHG